MNTSTHNTVDRDAPPKAIMARALVAKASGDLIKVIGTGTCTVYAGTWAEDWLYGDYE